MASRSDRRLLGKERKRLGRRNERSRDRMAKIGLVANLKPERRHVPDGDGAWMEFTPLRDGELEEAKAIALSRNMNMDIGPKVADALARRQQSDKEKPLMLSDLDTATLLRYGLVGWGGGVFEGAAFDDAQKKDLTAAAADWAARQIFEMSHLTAGEGSNSEPSGKAGGDQTHNGSEPASSSPSLTLAVSSAQASRRP